MTEYEFEIWFKAADLGPLEDVRDYVMLHVYDNASDVPVDEQGDCMYHDVLTYLDDPQMAAETFDVYRR